jgi:DNA-directed RNA polymerase subunit RPC12/RpoP
VASAICHQYRTQVHAGRQPLVFQQTCSTRRSWDRPKGYHDAHRINLWIPKNNVLESGSKKMAQCRRFVCSGCGRKIDAWSDGNPYYIDEAGVKKYAYHPDHDALAKCIGNDVPHLCLSCGKEVVIDSRSSLPKCPDCDSKTVVCTYHLDGKECPTCKNGRFVQDKSFFAVS